MQLLIIRSQLTLRKTDLRDMFFKVAVDKGYDLSNIASLDQFKNLFGSAGDNIQAIRILPRGIELLWSLLMAMQEPKKETAEEAKSPSKAAEKKRLSLA